MPRRVISSFCLLLEIIAVGGSVCMSVSVCLNPTLKCDVCVSLATRTLYTLIYCWALFYMFLVVHVTFSVQPTVMTTFKPVNVTLPQSTYKHIWRTYFSFSIGNHYNDLKESTLLLNGTLMILWLFLIHRDNMSAS